MHSSGQHSSSVVARELDVGVLPDVDKDRVTSGEISFVVLPVVGSNVDEEPVVCGFVVPSLLGVAVGVDIHVGCYHVPRPCQHTTLPK